MCNSVALHIIVKPSPPPSLEPFHLPKLEVNNVPFLAPSSPWQPPLNLVALRITCEWTCAVFVLLGPAYFLSQDVFRVHPCCGASELTSSLSLSNIPSDGALMRKNGLTSEFLLYCQHCFIPQHNWQQSCGFSIQQAVWWHCSSILVPSAWS